VKLPKIKRIDNEEELRKQLEKVMVAEDIAKGIHDELRTQIASMMSCLANI
jgi:hypothetical protein